MRHLEDDHESLLDLENIHSRAVLRPDSLGLVAAGLVRGCFDHASWRARQIKSRHCLALSCATAASDNSVFRRSLIDFVGKQHRKARQSYNRYCQSAAGAMKLVSSRSRAG